MPAAISVAVFARNEAAGLQDCLRALDVALDGQDASLTVVLNGTTDDSAGAVRRFAGAARHPVRLFDIPFADKSNAWNQYVHALAPSGGQGTALHVFVDAYATVTPGSIRALAAALAETPRALAAAALPSCGRSAPAQRSQMRRSPSLHGSLHALRGDFLDRVRAAGIRLPVGLYRGDGLIGSLVVHDLDAVANPWNIDRIVLAEAATWTVAPLSPFRPRDLQRLWNRRIQQARGGFEDAALRECIYSDNLTGLPPFADQMVADWLVRNPSHPGPRPVPSAGACPPVPSARPCRGLAGADPAAGRAGAERDRSAGRCGRGPARAAQPDRRMMRVRVLDSLRGLAAFMVVLYHGWQTLPPGPLADGIRQALLFTPFKAAVGARPAVILFFVLSGYVLALALTHGPGISWGGFVLRRICRVWLPFAVSILLSAGLYWLMRPAALAGVHPWFNADPWSAAPDAAALWRHLAMLGDTHSAHLNVVMWSLTYELRISLVFPLILLAAQRLPLRVLLPGMLALQVAPMRRCAGSACRWRPSSAMAGSAPA